jgi:hypothetical protein
VRSPPSSEELPHAATRGAYYLEGITNWTNWTRGKETRKRQNDDRSSVMGVRSRRRRSLNYELRQASVAWCMGTAGA